MTTLPPTTIEELRIQLASVLDALHACGDKIDRGRLFSGQMVPLLANPLLADLERESYLDRAWDYVHFPKEMARTLITQTKIEAVLEPCLLPLQEWADPYLLAGHLPDPAEVAAHLEQAMLTLAPMDRQVRTVGQQYILKILTDLKVTNAKALVEDALVAAIAPSKDAPLDPEQLRIEAVAILATPDPLTIIVEELSHVYGGDPTAPLLVYLAMTSRVLALREGSLLFHVQLLGPPSTGKTWAYKSAQRLFPSQAMLEYHSGTPRVLIYDTRSFVHRAIIFAEVGTIPTDDQHQPVAVAVRKLTEENRLEWNMVVRDEKTGRHIVEVHHREGPTVLITTGVKRMEAQMDSRLYVYELPEEAEQNRRSIIMQANLEEGGMLPPPSPALVAYQGLLQTMAPVQVVIPFVRRLGVSLANLGGVDSRVRRDVLKLFTLIKVVALLRHAQRGRTASGAIEAAVDDYRFVRELIAKQYIMGGGPSERVRDTIAAVTTLYQQASPAGKAVSAAMVAQQLNIAPVTAWNYLQRAITGGWVVNAEYRRSYPANLQPGDPLPDRVNLPTPEELEGEGRPLRRPMRRPIRG